MRPSHLFGIALLVGGACLLYFGYQAANSPIEEIGKAFTGRYSDETMVYLIGGGIAAATGLLLFFGNR